MNRPEELIQLSIPETPSRREALQWVLAAVAASQLPGSRSALAARDRLTPDGASLANQGYGTNLDLTRVYRPGDLWPLTFTEAQRKTAAALADTILPDDQFGPAASAVGVPAMIDEWISAPYPEQQKDAPVILNGLKWIDAEADRRFKKAFAECSPQQQTAICQDICFAPEVKPEFREAAQFFSVYRTRCASAYYATPQGWKAIGYVGNVPLASFEGPPREVLDKLGLEQTVV